METGLFNTHTNGLSSLLIETKSKKHETLREDFELLYKTAQSKLKVARLGFQH